jgi:hypothetical protein
MIFAAQHGKTLRKARLHWALWLAVSEPGVLKCVALSIATFRQVKKRVEI